VVLSRSALLGAAAYGLAAGNDCVPSVDSFPLLRRKPPVGAVGTLLARVKHLPI